MPLCPQVTITPVTVTSTGMTQTSVIAANAPATTEQLTVVNTQATAALAAAASALSAANTAYSLAVNSLQDSAYTITNASNQITAIDGTGITVYSGASATTGARVVLNSAGLAGYNSSNVATFSITASTGAAVFAGDVTGATITGGTLNIGGNAIINSSGFLTATGATITGAITATSGSFTGSITSTTGTIGGWTITSDTLASGTGAVLRASTGNISGNTVTAFTDFYGPTIYVTGAVDAGTTITAAGLIRAYGELYAAGHSTTSNSAQAYVFSGTGRIARSTASSQRYKEDITELTAIEELNPRKLLDLPVRAFKYKATALKETDDRSGVLMPGFIAEEVDAVYPIAADYLDGPESWNDRIIVPAILALVQDQEKRITALEGG